MPWLSHFLATVLLAAGPQSEDPARLLERANASYQGHRPEEAVQLYREYLSRNPNRADVRDFLGAALLNLGKTDEALQESTRAIAIDARYGRAYVLAGRVHAARESWSLAQEAFAKALRIDPRDREAWYFSGRAWYDENHFEKALEALQKARTLGSEQSRVYENLGLVYEALGRLEEAGRAFRRGVELAGAEHHPYLSYGIYLHKQSSIDASIEMLTQALTLAPGSLDAHFELGKALLQGGKLDAAARVLEQGLAISDQCRLRYLLVSVYAQAGRSEDADRQAAAAGGCLDAR